MSVIDLQPEHHNTYFNCLEDWSGEMAEAGDHKACWYHRYKEKGLRVKVYLDDDGQVAGMIHYLPIEESFVQGEGLYFILCIWVHSYKEGIGKRDGRGIGTALLEAAEEDAIALGARGMAAWGLWLPFWMKASWFKKHGYKKSDRDFISLLVWKPFDDAADLPPPKWIKQKKSPSIVPNRVSVTAFINGWCPAQNLVYERTRRACEELGEQVVFDSIDTSQWENFEEWGITDGIFIDGKRLSYGPPLPFEKIRAKIAKRLKRLPKS
ncbi:MAG: GNAT family N-acetyltransferase [Gammaproteobacteria bacterium]|nr:GNAT family N-acetyltransferase [Gammaproteobacteria bacterium]